jgi:uncharacterized RDD family membrane protein YckC
VRHPADPELSFETPERVALSLPVAGLGDRAFAHLVDLVLLFLAWVVILVVYSAAGDLLRDLQALSIPAQILAVVAVLLSGWGWDVAWEVLWRGQTPGKRALGIRVVRADGAPVGLPESLVRNLSRAAELPLGYAPAILAVALSRRRQRLGDVLAGTIVVRERRYDLSRYGPGAEAAARFAFLRGRATALLAPGEFDRLADFLRRRPGLDAEPRARVARRLAGALAARAGIAAPSDADAEPFLEALAAHYASAEG